MTPRSAIPLTDVATLRWEFDSSFSVPSQPPNADLEQFLAIKTAGQPLALRVAELSRLEVRREIVPLPVENPHLLGLAGIQGRLLPIYSLAGLLGFERDDSDWRWIAVSDGEESLGLAFGSLDAHFSVSQSHVLDLGSSQAAKWHRRYAVRLESEVRNIVQLQSLRAAIQGAAHAWKGSAKESPS